METILKQLDLSKSFDKLKNPEYGLKRLDLTDQIVLTKNDQPLMIVPEHLREDFIHLCAVSNVANKI